MQGSTRTELQHWKLNLDNWTACILQEGHRQLLQMASRVSIKAIADEIAQAILARDRNKPFVIDERNGDLVVDASSIFPTGSGFKRTVEGRRMRLCNYLAESLSIHGWKQA